MALSYGVVCCGVVWCALVWCDVVWVIETNGVVWCGVAIVGNLCVSKLGVASVGDLCVWAPQRNIKIRIYDHIIIAEGLRGRDKYSFFCLHIINWRHNYCCNSNMLSRGGPPGRTGPELYWYMGKMDVSPKNASLRRWCARILISHPHGNIRRPKISPGDGLGPEILNFHH